MKVYLTTHPECITPLDSFRAVAAPLVHHPLGWKNLVVVDNESEAESVVTLAPTHIIRQLFGAEYADLSACNMLTRAIWVNEDRWRRTAPDKSQLPLAAYRAYVVQHELGHALGYEHAQCHTPGQAVPVMVQQTLGIGKCRPNPFPTAQEG